MKKQFFLLSSLCVILSACDNNGINHADNTARNVRDRNGQTLTAGDQAENEIDRELTQKIRQSIMDDDALSTNAKNVKIITLNGVVTLRGPVNSDREKIDIDKKARAISGVKNVDNKLEIIRADAAARGVDNRDLNH